MLVLSRKKSESLVLELPGGEQVTVTIADLDAHRVRVGIEAPRSVRVMRSELLERDS